MLFKTVFQLRCTTLYNWPVFILDAAHSCSMNFIPSECNWPREKQTSQVAHGQLSGITRIVPKHSLGSS